VFKTIIVKTFHAALDVMIATARYRIGCKGFVTCSRKDLTNSSFMASSKFSRRALCWRETRCAWGQRTLVQSPSAILYLWNAWNGLGPFLLLD